VDTCIIATYVASQPSRRANRVSGLVSEVGRGAASHKSFRGGFLQFRPVANRVKKFRDKNAVTNHPEAMGLKDVGFKRPEPEPEQHATNPRGPSPLQLAYRSANRVAEQHQKPRSSAEKRPCPGAHDVHTLDNCLEQRTTLFIDLLFDACLIHTSAW
jgi:hypothetical protein